VDDGPDDSLAVAADASIDICNAVISLVIIAVLSSSSNKKQIAAVANVSSEQVNV
jgi:hypothetical protein